MKRSFRLVFIVTMAFLWVLVVFLALNAYEVLRWRHVVNANDYVLQEKGVKLAPPVRGSNAPSPTYGPRLNPAGLSKTVPDEAPVDRQTLLEKGAKRFLAMAEEQRRALDVGLDETIFLIDLNKTVTALYTPREELNNHQAETHLHQSMGLLVPDDVRSLFIETAERTFQSGQVALKPAKDKRDREFFFYPVRGADGALTNVLGTIGGPYEVIPGSLWDITDFSLTKHAVNDANGRATNNFGFREKDVVVPKPAGLMRIVCVGGSTTDEGPTNDLTYPAILERKLNACFNGHPPIEVLNCGIPALYSARERARMLDYLEMQPDLILYYHAVNDLTYVVMPQWPDAVDLWRKILRASPFLNHHLNRWLLPSDAKIREMIQATSMENLRVMIDTAAARHVDMAFASFAVPDLSIMTSAERDYCDYLMPRQLPAGRYIAFSSYSRAVGIFNQLVKDLCTEKGLLYIPLAENFHGGLDLFWDYCHLGIKGIDLKTDIMLPYVCDYVRGKMAGADSGK